MYLNWQAANFNSNSISLPYKLTTSVSTQKQQLLQQIKLQSQVAQLMPLYNKPPTHNFNVTSLQTVASPSLAIHFSTITVYFSTISVHFNTIALTESPAQ